MFFYEIPPASLSDPSALRYTVEDAPGLDHSPTISAAKDAGFCEPDRSVRVTLQLREPGRVLVSKLETETIRPYTKTCRALLDQLRSLSEALHIELYLNGADDRSLLKRLDSLCAATQDARWRQGDLLWDVQDVDWAKLEPSKEPPAYELLVPATSPSAISETSVEREEPDLGAAKQLAPLASRGSKRKWQSSPPPADAPGAAALSAEICGELCALFQTALPSMPTREYTEPRLQPYLGDVGDAVRRRDSPAFDRAYARFVALVLLQSVVDNGDGGGGEPEVPDDVASLAKKDYLNDLFVLVSWTRASSRTGVLLFWKEFCQIGCAARHAVADGVPLDQGMEGQYGTAKAIILTRVVVDAP